MEIASRLWYIDLAEFFTERVCTMFGRRKKQAVPDYDRGGKFPVIRSSICTGEQVAGFKDPVSGKFEELMLIRNDKDLQEFMRQYQVEQSEIKREW